jgi:hypothetical protein
MYTQVIARSTLQTVLFSGWSINCFVHAQNEQQGGLLAAISMLTLSRSRGRSASTLLSTLPRQVISRYLSYSLYVLVLLT